MKELDEVGEFEDQLNALEDSMVGAQTVASSFAGELNQIRSTMEDAGRQVAGLSSGIGRGLRGAFDGLVFDGMKLSDALHKVGSSMANAAYSSAVNPLSKHFGQVLGGGVESLVQSAMPFAKGGAISQGRVTPFARGGVVNGPVNFPMRGGMGLMGEAGPEAIMPLTRGPDGKLGVRAGSGSSRAANVVVNVQTPDVASFKRSEGQIAAQIGRALSRGQRNR